MAAENEIVITRVYREVVAPERIVYTLAVAEVEGKTRLTDRLQRELERRN